MAKVKVIYNNSTINQKNYIVDWSTSDIERLMRSIKGATTGYNGDSNKIFNGTKSTIRRQTMKQVYTNLPETKPSLNSTVLDIVHTVDLRDIQSYVYKKYIGQIEHPTIDAMQLSEVQMLCDKFKVDGYEIIDTDYLKRKVKMKEKEIEERTIEIVKLRHEVSVLTKKLNQLEKEINK